MKIDNREIGLGFPPYIIAEMSANHNGSIEKAFQIIEMAKARGADAVKLQTYKPDTITMKSNRPEFKIDHGLWKGKTLYDLYESAYMPWDWHEPLFQKAKDVGITIFSSPFDFTAVDLLEKLDAPAYKIASFEAIDIPLIEYVAQTGKPMIISTGMANKREIQDAVDSALAAGCRELAILHCVSGYPAPSSDYNLRTIADMREGFNCEVGLSDHTLDNTSAIVSVAMGASIIEKHVTLDRTGGGADDSFSLEPADLENLCVGAKTAWESMGKVDYELKKSEKDNVKFRRSLYFAKNMNKGDVINADCIRSIRPGYGLPPKLYKSIIGSTVTVDIKKATAVTEDLLSDFKQD